MLHIHKKGIRAFGNGIGISSLLSGGFATLLYTVKIPITVILPTTAPIWVGIATMVFLLLKD